MAPTQGSPDQESQGPAQNHSVERPHDFSLVLGGPLFQLFRKLHLSGDELEHLPRRAAAFVLIVWLPLLLLVSGGKAGLVSFLRDVEVHVRFLAALPILIAGERIVHVRQRIAVRRFVERRIVSTNHLALFDDAIDSAIRLLNSAFAQLAMLILVYTLGLWLWQSRVPIVTPTWYATPDGPWNLTPAGRWLVFISIPIFQFMLLCWYWRFFVWCRFLFQVSRINLNLVTTHPDRCAGIGFLGRSAYAFAPVLFAQGAMVAGVVANHVLYRGESLMSFKLRLGGFVAFFVLAVLGPLLVFTPQLAAAKRKGLVLYGDFAQDYVEGFQGKWITKDPAPVENLLGTADIQSLADLSNSYEIVASMRLVPFGVNDMTRLAVVTAAPLLPLLFTVFSVEELFMRLIKVIF